MVGKTQYPQIEPEESINRIRQVYDEIEHVEKKKRSAKAEIENISNVSYLMILLKLAQKENFIQKRVKQYAIIDRLKELGLFEGNTVTYVEKLTGIKLFK